MVENPTHVCGVQAEAKALALLKGIVEENSRAFKMDGNQLTVTTQKGKRYFIEIRTAKVYNESGKFVCVSVLAPNLPIADQVIAKSLHLLCHPDSLSNLDQDLLFKLAFAGVEPRVELPWIKSISYSTLGETFSDLIGADFAVKEIRIGGLSIRLQMWYVNYNNRFRSIRSKHIKGSMGGIILCNANSDPEKVGNCQASIDELKIL